jgi:hypothetical protein
MTDLISNILPLKLLKLKLRQAGIEILNEDPAKNRYHARI